MDVFKKPTRKRSKRFSIRKGGGTPRFAFLGDLQKGKKALQHRKPVQISGCRGCTCARGCTWCLQLTMALPTAWGCQAPRRPPSLKSKRARKSIVLRVSPKLSLCTVLSSSSFARLSHCLCSHLCPTTCCVVWGLQLQQTMAMRRRVMAPRRCRATLPCAIAVFRVVLTRCNFCFGCVCVRAQL